MYPTVFPDWNFLERGAWLWTLRRSTVFCYLCDQSDGRSEVGELSFIFGEHGPDSSTNPRACFFWRGRGFLCTCFWVHCRCVFDRKVASMLLFPHKYGAGMTLSRLWMDSCQDNSQAPTGPELDIYTWAQNAGMVVEKIYSWRPLRSSYCLQCLDLIGVVSAAALCDV